MSASIWNPGGSIIPQADPNSQIKSEPFTATEGQTTFVLTQFTYTLGVGALSIFRNGVKLVGASDVTEVSNTTFSISPCDAGDSIEAVGNTAIANPDAVLAEILATRDEIIVIAAEVDADKVTAQLAADEAAASAASIDLPIPVGSGGTGSTDAAGARTALGISALTTPNTPAGNLAATNVQAAINELDSEKAPLASPIFTGPVTSPQYYNVTQPYGALQVAGVDVMRFGSDTSGQLAGFRQKLINATFEINQRAVSGTVTLAAGQYGHDRWKAGSAGCTYTFSTVVNVTTITITAGSLVQIVEGRNLRSGNHTLSWQGTAQGKFWEDSFSASGHVGYAVGGVDVPIEFGVGTLILPQLEPGVIATATEFRDDELSRCQRYLPAWRSAGVSASICGAHAINNGIYVDAMFYFPVTPRCPPTGLLCDDAAKFSFFNGTFYIASALAFGNASETVARLRVSIPAATAFSGGLLFANTTSGFLLFTGCEL